MPASPIDPRRRRVLLAGAGLAGLAACHRAVAPAFRFASDPFGLGVASGDPVPDGFVIWTRLAPTPPEGGGLPDAAFEVEWEVAADESFATPLRRGVASARPEWGHSVHVEVEGLAPDRWYFYRFHAGGAVSPAGRSRTAPEPGAPLARLRFAYASCQHYEQGHYAAYRDLAEAAPDLVLHLGDYIYEAVWGGGAVRQHGAGEPQTLAQYRARHALYRSDPDLQRAHAACPWLLAWDDHEVDNDYAGAVGQDGEPPETFLLRRAAAYRAYWEHMPLRERARPRGAAVELYQASVFGDLAAFHVLDTRQHRDDQPCAVSGSGGGRVVPECAAAFEPARTMLGELQERWLLDNLARSRLRWNVLAQPLLMAPLDRTPGPGAALWTDGWDGYAAARERILARLADAATPNPVVIGGDTHAFWAAELADARGRRAATEFAGTSISSPGPPAGWFVKLLPENPHIRHFDSAWRGYVAAELTPERLSVDFRAVDDVRRPDSAVHSAARFVVEAGRAAVLTG